MPLDIMKVDSIKNANSDGIIVLRHKVRLFKTAALIPAESMIKITPNPTQESVMIIFFITRPPMTYILDEVRIMSIKKLAQKYERAKSKLNRHSSLQIFDNTQVVADGCRRIVSCDENIAVIDLACNRVTIMGDSLKLRNWGSDGVTVSGVIKSIEFGGILC